MCLEWEKENAEFLSELLVTTSCHSRIRPWGVVSELSVGFTKGCPWKGSQRCNIISFVFVMTILSGKSQVATWVLGVGWID